MRPRRTPVLAGPVAALLAVLVVLAGCSSAPLARPEASDRTSPPELGACYPLTPEDVGSSSNDTDPVACGAAHTSQTFAVGTLPESTGAAYDDRAHGRWIYPRCEAAFEKFLGVDESLAMRIQLSWAWFRPSQEGWDKGARWYRCDLVGGSTEATAYRPLPQDAKGLFAAKPPEQWLTCASGPTVLEAEKLPCTEPHDWRAVTTIKLGQPDDEYPGERLVQVRTRDFCSDSVGAWMNYPVDYEYGYTWFKEAEWQAGNRRSVCWARTDR
ncbi:Septum formation [Nocardioides scoriae]|uniref:Septum formation n=1 Tax=Nocardioides scoriae TaxID=642780 RepID=A0A1H1QPQ0_9ACTN|nr:septum formation family protein [Nocardioides scoriae]SDS25313.1 Septum formation [Nocardioides scoriae]